MNRCTVGKCFGLVGEYTFNKEGFSMSLETRLAKLEMENRKWKLAAVALLLMGLCGVAAGAQLAKSLGAISVDSITFVGANGEAKATLGVDGTAVVLSQPNAQGAWQPTLVVDAGSNAMLNADKMIACQNAEQTMLVIDSNSSRILNGTVLNGPAMSPAMAKDRLLKAGVPVDFNKAKTYDARKGASK